MGFKIRDRLAQRKLRKAIQALSPKVRKKILQQTARKLLRTMRVRVETQGRGTDGKVMTYKGRFYSPDYAERRRESGRTTDRRILSWTAKMHGERRIKKTTEDWVLIGWGPGKSAEKASGQERMVRWIKPTKAEMIKTKRIMDAAFKAAIKAGRETE